MCLGILGLSSCASTKVVTEYIYVQPECYQIPRKALPDIDSGVLYDVLTLPHSLSSDNAELLSVGLPVGYDGHQLYWQLVEREKRIVDMMISNETIVKSICKSRE